MKRSQPILRSPRRSRLRRWACKSYEKSCLAVSDGWSVADKEKAVELLEQKGRVLKSQLANSAQWARGPFPGGASLP